MSTIVAKKYRNFSFQSWLYLRCDIYINTYSFVKPLVRCSGEQYRCSCFGPKSGSYRKGNLSIAYQFLWTFANKVIIVTWEFIFVRFRSPQSWDMFTQRQMQRVLHSVKRVTLGNIGFSCIVTTLMGDSQQRDYNILLLYACVDLNRLFPAERSSRLRYSERSAFSKWDLLCFRDIPIPKVVLPITTPFTVKSYYDSQTINMVRSYRYRKHHNIVGILNLYNKKNLNNFPSGFFSWKNN